MTRAPLHVHRNPASRAHHAPRLELWLALACLAVLAAL